MFFVLFMLFLTASFFAFLLFFRHRESLNGLSNSLHFNGILLYCLPPSLLFLHNGIQWVFMCQCKILTLCIRYLLFEDLPNFLAIFFHVSWFTHQILFSIFIRVLNLVSPIVHPVHTVEVGSWNKTSLHLHPLQFLVMSLFLQFLLHFKTLPVDLPLFFFSLPNLLDVLHRSGMPDLLHQVIESHCRISSLKYYNIILHQLN